MLKSFVNDYCTLYGYPDDAVQALTQAAAAVDADPAMSAYFDSAYAAYQASPTDETVINAYKQHKELAADFAVPWQTTELLLFIRFTEHLHVLYRNKNLPERYFVGVMDDIRSKTIECHDVIGIWGNRTGDWFIPFFCLDRFAIGRLQYNYVTMPKCETLDGLYRFEGGEKALTVHIPSLGPLRSEDVEASLAEAAAFYADDFEGDSVLFNCDSWLLFSGHEEMLPETSNIRRFRQHFHMMADTPDPTLHDMWRIFNTLDVKNFAALPRDTGLRRAYAAWLESGKPVGHARGVRYIKKQK